MIDKGIVRGDAEQAKPLIIGTDTVYVHTNIREYDKLDSDGKKIGVGYEYNEIQYDKDEYIRKLTDEA